MIGEFEPGSRGQVLKNLLSIKSEVEMEEAETEALLQDTGFLTQLNFGVLEGTLKNKYFAAVRAGMDKDYRPMERIFE